MTLDSVLEVVEVHVWTKFHGLSTVH